jgi:riboflavin kinase/FMN adenylyltransferase
MKIANNAVPVVINVGIRPTLAGEPIVRVEAHCFTTKFGDDELYQRPFALYFHERLRDEQKFAGLAELTAAIANDISQAELILSRLNH